MKKEILIISLITFIICITIANAAILDTWNNGSRNIQYNFEENNTAFSLLDSAANPNNHNGTNISGAAHGYYVTGANTTGSALNFNASGYYAIANFADYSNMTAFETCFAIKQLNMSTASTIFSADATSLRIKSNVFQSKNLLEIETKINGSAKDWFTGTPILANNTWQYICIAYNTTHLVSYINATYNGSSAVGTGQTPKIITRSQLGADNGGTIFNGTLDCFTMYINNTLSDAARLDAYNNCFNQSSGSSPITQPSTPTGFTSPSNTTNSTYLTWNAASGAEKYLLWGGDGINWYNTTNLYYNWTGLNASTSYQFNVSSYNSTMTIPNSNVSNSITVTTSPIIYYPSIFGIDINTTNIVQNEKVKIVANVTHPTKDIDRAILEITFPNGTKKNYSMVKSS